MNHAPNYPAADPTVMGMFKWSLLFHGALACSIVVGVWVQHQGDTWGGNSPGGGAVAVGTVQHLPGIPLPTPQIQTDNRVVDESKGLHKEEPKPKVEPPPDATPLQKFQKEQPPKYQTRPSRVLENKTPPPPNAVPYGGGGSPSEPLSNAQTQTFQLGGNSTGSVSVPGAGGTGDFGSRYAWYVDAVRNRISSNWLQSLIDPSIRYAPRVVVTFTILRNGTIANIQFTQRSGYTAVDNSALRALQASSPFQSLPGDYSGQSINVEFWFDFKR